MQDPRLTSRWLFSTPLTRLQCVLTPHASTTRQYLPHARRPLHNASRHFSLRAPRQKEVDEKRVRQDVPQSDRDVTTRTSLDTPKYSPSRIRSFLVFPLIAPGRRVRSTVQQQHLPRSRRRIIWLYRVIWLLGIGYAATAYTLSSSPSTNHPIFSPPRFTPFTIIDREDVSPTGFILTVRPRNPTYQTSDPYADSWTQGTWSVEFKQPQLQIARSYTPLPPRPDLPPANLRFLIRRETGGEVSNYLANLPLHATAELRGPHPGVDLPSSVTDVVFLAGGTGIAPAMQVAHTLLENRSGGERPRIHILWANRKRDDCVERGAVGTVVRELREMQQQFPENLRVEYLVDEEGTFIDQKRISAATQKAGSGAVGPDPKLLFVSGPEGFVNFLAGRKIWEDGEEKQGNVSGVIRKMGLKGWTVWKL